MDRVEVSLQEARADIRLKPGAPLEVKTLRTTVIRAGFTPTWIRFEAVGQVVEQDDRPLFKVSGSDQRIPLAENETLHTLRQKAAGKEITITALIPAKQDVAQIESYRIP